MKVSVSEAIIIDGEHAVFITQRDVEEFNAAISCVDMSFSRDEILEFVSRNIHLYYKGKMWGFNDTEVRDDICEELENPKVRKAR